eukprot:1231864-Pyramimonas_sp.AAC.2
MADGGAKDVAMGRAGNSQLCEPALDGAVDSGQRDRYFHIDGTPVTKVKQQLRDRVTRWLASHLGYRCAVRDMWSGAAAEGLDRHASNEAIWGFAGGWGGGGWSKR